MTRSGADRKREKGKAWPRGQTRGARIQGRGPCQSARGRDLRNGWKACATAACAAATPRAGQQLVSSTWREAGLQAATQGQDLDPAPHSLSCCMKSVLNSTTAALPADLRQGPPEHQQGRPAAGLNGVSTQWWCDRDCWRGRTRVSRPSDRSTDSSRDARMPAQIVLHALCNLRRDPVGPPRRKRRRRRSRSASVQRRVSSW
jgi:hypothetical protein